MISLTRGVAEVDDRASWRNHLGVPRIVSPFEASGRRASDEGYPDRLHGSRPGRALDRPAAVGNYLER